MNPLLVFLWLCLLATQETPWPPHHELPEEDGARALNDMRATWSTAREWSQRADTLRAHVRATTGLQKVDPTAHNNTELVTHDLHNFDNYSVESFYLESFPGFFVSGNLYRPVGHDGPHPIVLAPHGHARANENQPEGRFRADYQKLCATLARMGAVVATWDMVGWGENTQVPHARAVSTTYQCFNTQRVLDALIARADTDSTRVGITGSSGGGTQSFLATLIDPRICVSVPVVMVSAHFFGGCSCESGLPIHLGEDFQTCNVEFAAAAAPRPLMLISVGGDWTRNTPEVEFPYIQAVYDTLGVGERCANVHLADEQHDYGPNKRAASVGFLAKHLGLELAENSENSKITILSRDQLRAFTDEHPRPAHAAQGEDAVAQAFSKIIRASEAPSPH